MVGEDYELRQLKAEPQEHSSLRNSFGVLRQAQDERRKSQNHQEISVHAELVEAFFYSFSTAC